MGDVASGANKLRRKFQDVTGVTKVRQSLQKGIEKPLRTGATSAQRDVAKQTALQQQKEQARLLETEDEIARRKAGAGARGAGRGSLIRSSPSALATNLGGT